MLIVPRTEAVYRSRLVYDSPLDLKHQYLAKLGDISADPNTRRVIAGFENVFQIIESPDFNHISQGGSRRRGLNILSLDGGGVKGLFSLLVLQKLMDEVEVRGSLDGLRRLPCEYFDLICGTSTGGLISIMLGRLQMDIISVIKLYRGLSRSIFDSGSGPFSLLTKGQQAISGLRGAGMYDGEVLKRAICDTVSEQLGARERERMQAAGLFAEDVRLVPPEGQKARCFVCAVSERNHKAERIRSYLPRKRDGHSERDTASYKIWQAARATSAAPIYFPAIEIDSHMYFDGGLDCNNPILELVDEAQNEFSNARIDSIVSIGTGVGNVVEPTGSIIQVIQSMINRVTSTEKQHEEFQRRPDYEKFRESYFRFQAGTELGSIGLAEVDRLDDIEQIAREYLNLPEVKSSISKCATRILNSARF
jgi:predicted acylesterase/phospholipase RssA